MAMMKSRKIGMGFVLLICVVFVSAIVAAAVIRLSLDADKSTTVGDYPIVLSIEDPDGTEVAWGTNAVIGNSYFSVLNMTVIGTYDVKIMIEVGLDGASLALGDMEMYIGDEAVFFSVVDGKLVAEVPVGSISGVNELPVEVVFNKLGTFDVTFWVAQA